MPLLDASTLLTLWESGFGQPPVRQALALLPAAYPERTPAEWARAPLGERDARLLDLRERLFGTRLEMLAACPRCGEMMELIFATGDVRGELAPPEHSGRLIRDGYEVEYEVPGSEHVLAVAEEAPDRAAQRLLERCILSARKDGAAMEPAALPNEIRQAVELEMSAQDPGAECKVALECAACGHGWTALFDIVRYLWSELEDWAHATLRDVHTLASAYGWTEREVLALSPARRQIYIELAAG